MVMDQLSGLLFQNKTMELTTKFNLTVIDDNIADIIIVEEVVRRKINQKFQDVITVTGINSGEDALNYFKTKESNVPSLILLDLNMPKVTGITVLKYLKESKKYTATPIIIFTSSLSPEDIYNSYKNHANGYVNKPTDIDILADVINSMFDFWFKVAVYPPAKYTKG